MSKYNGNLIKVLRRYRDGGGSEEIFNRAKNELIDLVTSHKVLMMLVSPAEAMEIEKSNEGHREDGFRNKSE